jgi:hypothetical protein
VTHYHTRPEGQLFNWIRRNRATVITTIRHPGDVLISLYHHVHDFRRDEIDHDFLRRMLSRGFERRGLTTYAESQPFSADLDCSLEWMACEGTHTVRYEDLRSDPVATLRELTDRIHPAPIERIEAAVDMCDMEVMRRTAGKFSGFFRQGRIGGWRELLAPDVVEILRATDPYASQVARLGYSMDLSAFAPPNRIRASSHLMTTLRHFDNGVSTAPVLVQCFFWAPHELRVEWERQLTATGPGTFYHWLNSPAPTSGQGPYKTLALTNIAAFIYSQRPDVRMAYPDLDFTRRYDYVRWFVRRAAVECGLDDVFVNRQRSYLLRWANAGTPVGRLQASNFVAHLCRCRCRIDVDAEFPNIGRMDRRALIRDVVRAAKALDMDPNYIRPMQDSLGRHWLPERIRRWCGLAG